MKIFVKAAVSATAVLALGVAAWAVEHVAKQTGIQLGGHTFSATASHVAGHKETSHADLNGDHHIGTLSHSNGKAATVHLVGKPALCESDCAAAHAVEVRHDKKVVAGKNVTVATHKGAKGAKHAPHVKVGEPKIGCDDVLVHVHFLYPLATDPDGNPVYADINFDMPLADFLVMLGLST